MSGVVEVKERDSGESRYGGGRGNIVRVTSIPTNSDTRANTQPWSPSLKARLYGLTRPVDELLLRAAVLWYAGFAIWTVLP